MDEYESEHFLDPKSLPEFDCLCELCDCGCFEESKQPHSITCKKLHRDRNKFAQTQRVNLSQSAAIQVPAPKGQLSEYQYQYFNTKDAPKTFRAKMHDNLDIFNPNKRAERFDSSSQSFEPQMMRSKVLDRLSRMMPNNERIGWHRSESGSLVPEPGSRDSNYLSLAGSDLSKGYQLNKSFTTMDHHKDDYMKAFEELNRGFVDAYTEKRGSELVSMSRQGESDFTSASNLFKSNSGSVHSMPNVREHDFRSPWMPKKFPGRNMFVSHIDSTLFPDKQHKNIEVQTQYNHFYVPGSEKKQQLLTTPSPYQKLDKSVRFAVTNDNKYIPTVISLPRKEPLYEENFHAKPQSNIFEPGPGNSVYGSDFKTPKSSMKSSGKIPLCKAAALQSLMRRDQFYKQKFDKNQEHSLESLKKRQNEINAILMNS